MVLYDASKGFVHSLTRAIAVDHGPQIRCNSICPGWIRTEMTETAFETAVNLESADSHDPQAVCLDILLSFQTIVE